MDLEGRLKTNRNFLFILMETLNYWYFLIEKGINKVGDVYFLPLTPS